MNLFSLDKKNVHERLFFQSAFIPGSNDSVVDRGIYQLQLQSAHFHLFLPERCNRNHGDAVTGLHVWGKRDNSLFGSFHHQI